MSPMFGESVPRKSQRQENVPSHIFTPRSYQVEILDSALQQNTIVCLGSTSGKSFIIVMLIKEMAHAVRRCGGKEGKKTIFLGNTTECVNHQAGIINRETDLTVQQYVSLSDVTHWDKERWDENAMNHDVLAMTPEVLIHLLVNEFITFSQMNLLIIDECERVVLENHPYTTIMEGYLAYESEDRPRILGLTESVLSDGVSTPVDLEKKISTLENKLNCVAETSTDMIVADLYGAKPEEILTVSDKYEDQTGMVEELEKILQDLLKFIQEMNITVEEGADDPRLIPKTVVLECVNILHLLGPWCVGRVAQAFCKQVVKLINYEHEQIPKMLMQMTRTTLQMIQKMVDYAYERTIMDIDDFRQYISPKALKLIDTLKGHKPDDNFMIFGGDEYPDMDNGGESSEDSMDLSDDEEGTSKPEPIEKKSKVDQHSKREVHYVAKRTVTTEPGISPEKQIEEGLCGIIFVERRHTAFALNKLIQEMCNWDADLYFVRSCHITGKSNHKPGAAVRAAEEVYRKQEEVLRQFRNKEVNLLVSTNVLEEGVDVPRCNLVCRFDPPVDYRSYIMSKGRARAPKSKYYLFVDEAKQTGFSQTLATFKGFENILMGRCQSQDDLGDEESEEAVTTQLQPYFPNPKDQTVFVSLSSAILLVNRYCAKLPSDAFTHLTPRCSTVFVDRGQNSGYMSTLQLPINSPIKEPIVGEVQPTKRMAKMAVALKACEILHRKGELDDTLQPVGKELIRYEDEEGEWEETQGQARPGTTKRKQYYYKKPAKALLGHPKPGTPCCLYAIRMVLTCPITEEQNTRGRKIHDPDETPRGFGILSGQRIPLVPQFPVFTRSGEVTTSIDLVSAETQITEEEYTRLKKFHQIVFTQVLRLEKDPMKFELDNAVTSYVIVPLLKDNKMNLCIDWDFITLVERTSLTSSFKALTSKPREKFIFNREVFEDAVVMPAYRNIDQPQYFYVAEIRTDLNPRSPFPSPELYDTFATYYNSKYSLEITNLQQPLLDVDHTSARLNLLTPRYMNQKGVALPTSSAETRRARRENLQQKQILVPELCDVHPFPASLWRKAVCLPAILYRMNSLLVADEIRIAIAKGALLGVADLSPDYRFPQLEFGFSTKPTDAVKDGEKQGVQDPPLGEKAPGHGEPPLNGEDQVSGEAVDEKPLVSEEALVERAVCEEAAVDEALSVNEDISDDKQDASSPSSASLDHTDTKHSETLKADDVNCNDDTENEDDTSGLISPGSNKPTNDPDSDTKISDYNHSDHSLTAQILTNNRLPTTAQKDIAPEKCHCQVEQQSKKAQESFNKLMNESQENHDNGNKLINDSCTCGGAVSKGEPDLYPRSDAGMDSLITNFSQLYIDTQTCCLNQGDGNMDDSNFFTPSLPKDSGPSSQTSQSSYHTAETSCTPPSISPAHRSYSHTVKPIDNQQHTMDNHVSSECPDSDPDVVQKGLDSRHNQQNHVESFVCDKLEKLKGLNNSHLCIRSEALLKDKLQLQQIIGDEVSKDDIMDQCQCKLSLSFCDRCNSDKKNQCISQVDSGKSLQFYSSAAVGETEPCQHNNKNQPPLYDITLQNDKDICMDCGSNNSEKEAAKPREDLAKPTESNAESTHDADLMETEEGSEERNQDLAAIESCEEEQRGKEEEDITPLIRFDQDVDLESFIGPSPCIILQTLTMSNANDFFNLERLETIGDSFLKFAITVYLYCSYPGIHEGKLSYLRSKQVSNYNLYKLGKKKGFPDSMVAAKFEPTENWLPPGFIIKTSDAYRGINVFIASSKDKYGIMDIESLHALGQGKEAAMTPEEKFRAELEEAIRPEEIEKTEDGTSGDRCLIPYNLQTQHSLPDKSIADCVEALIGCYLTTCGQRAALQFMSWLGLKVLPELEQNSEDGEQKQQQRVKDLGSIHLASINRSHQASAGFGHLKTPNSPLLMHVKDAGSFLTHQLDGYRKFEEKIQYTFRDKSYLLQAFTHASYHFNNITDCYQRLEFLGDAILDYVITRHLFEDVKKHSPGILTDLRSALVNNNIFAALAVKWDFHKFFKAISPQLFNVIEKFVARQKDKLDEISLDEEFVEIEEETKKGKEMEDIEIPKALGDIFESVAGAIYLDSDMSLDTVWRVYYRMMKPQIDMFTEKIPKSPVRELLELEPETAKFEKPERTLDGKIRVVVNVVGKGEFRGIGRNYRIAKSAAAKRALKFIKMIDEMENQFKIQAS